MTKKEILRSANITGLDFVEGKVDGEAVYFAYYKGKRKVFHVRTLSEWPKRRWVEELLTFVTAVMQGNTE